MLRKQEIVPKYNDTDQFQNISREQIILFIVRMDEIQKDNLKKSIDKINKIYSFEASLNNFKILEKEIKHM